MREIPTNFTFFSITFAIVTAAARNAFKSRLERTSSFGVKWDRMRNMEDNVTIRITS